MSRRSIRGFDPWRLMAALDSFSVEDLRKMLRELDEPCSGVKSELVGRVRTLIETNIASPCELFELAKKYSLSYACEAVNADSRGKKAVLVERLDRAVRLSPLASPLLRDVELPRPIHADTPEARLFLLELFTRLTRREQGKTRLAVGELVARVGLMRGAHYLRRTKIRWAIELLHAHGLQVEPSLSELLAHAKPELQITITEVGGNEPAERDEIDEADEVDDVGVSLSQDEREFLSWLQLRVEEHPRKQPTFSLAELVRKRGRFQANRRLRLRAVHELADFLDQHGWAMAPDYKGAGESPGIDSIVRVLRTSTKVVDTEDAHIDEHYALELKMALARADGRITEEELTEIRQQLEGRLGQSAESVRERLAAAIDRLRTDAIDVDTVANGLRGTLDDEERRRLIEQLFDVAVADGLFLPEEEALLRRLHQLLMTSDRHFQRLLKLCKTDSVSNPPYVQGSNAEDSGPLVETAANIDPGDNVQQQSSIVDAPIRPPTTLSSDALFDLLLASRE